MTPPSAVHPAGPSHEGRVLVVGLGFLGRHVTAGLLAAGERPAVLTRSHPGAEHIAGLGPLEMTIADAGDRAALEHALADVRHLVFCAGGLLPAHSELDPDLDAQLTLPPLRAVLAELGRRPGVTMTYLSSGGAVYGDPAALPAGEDDPTRPIGSYGRLRLECEREIEHHRRRHGLRVRVLRCATVYGEHQRPDRGQGAVVTFLRRVESGEPIVVYGAERNLRDYVYAGDVGRVVAALVDRTDGPAVVNVGSARGTSLTELIELVERQVGKQARVVFRRRRPFDVREIALDTRRLRGLLDFEPTGLEQGVELTHGWVTAGHAPAVQLA